MRRALATVFAVTMMLSMFMPLSSVTGAAVNPIPDYWGGETFAPTALDYWSYPTLYGVKYPYEAMDFRGGYFPADYAELQNPSDDEWVATGLLNSTWYWTDGLPGYDYDLPTYPNDNDTTVIDSVVMYAYACIDTSASSRTFHFEYAINETKANITAGTAIWHHAMTYSAGDRTVTNVYPQFLGFSADITTNESWNATMLRSNIWVRIYSEDHGAASKLYVDYVGLSYSYRWYPVPPPEEEGEVDLGGDLSLGVVGAMGLVGFAGMIAMPAVGIWMWRQDHANRMYSFVTLLVSFMVCFTMFLGSLE